MTTDVSGCGPYTTGFGTCTLVGGTITVTWALDASESLNGYDFEIRWDASELTLTNATQLYPDTGSPLSFLEAPSDPGDSRALVVSLVAASTVSLFELTFDALPAPADGMADLSWFANGNGLAPGSVVLENPAGAGLDVAAVVVPAMAPGSYGVLTSVLVAVGFWRLAAGRARASKPL